MITSIGRNCFLQNWLYSKFEQNKIPYYETILSRIAAYPEDYSIDIVEKYLQNYDQFCKDFLATGYVNNENNSREFISAELGCRIHFSQNMNLNQMCENLKHADVILIRLWNNVDCVKQLTNKLQFLKKIVSNPFKLIAFSQTIHEDIKCDDYTIYKIDMKSMLYTGNAEKYVKWWYVTDDDINIFEKVWNGIKHLC